MRKTSVVAYLLMAAMILYVMFWFVSWYTNFIYR